MPHDPVAAILDALKANPLINDDFKRGLDSADKTHREFRSDAKVLQDDLCEMLEALGLSTHARPQTPHELFQECIEEARRIKAKEPRDIAERIHVAILTMHDASDLLRAHYLSKPGAAALQESNEVLRSCYQVAARGGKETNWPALTTRIGDALEKQRAMISAVVDEVSYADLRASGGLPACGG